MGLSAKTVQIVEPYAQGAAPKERSIFLVGIGIDNSAFTNPWFLARNANINGGSDLRECLYCLAAPTPALYVDRQFQIIRRRFCALKISKQLNT